MNEWNSISHDINLTLFCGCVCACALCYWFQFLLLCQCVHGVWFYFIADTKKKKHRRSHRKLIRVFLFGAFSPWTASVCPNEFQIFGIKYVRLFPFSLALDLCCCCCFYCFYCCYHIISIMHIINILLRLLSVHCGPLCSCCNFVFVYSIVAININWYI